LSCTNQHIDLFRGVDTRIGVESDSKTAADVDDDLQYLGGVGQADLDCSRNDQWRRELGVLLAEDVVVY